MSDDIPDFDHPRANRYSGVPCPNCGAEFPTLWLLELHAEHCAACQPTPTEAPAASYACYYCSRSFISPAARWAHMHDAHGVGAADRRSLTQGEAAAEAEFEAMVLAAQAKRMARGL